MSSACAFVSVCRKGIDSACTILSVLEYQNAISNNQTVEYFKPNYFIFSIWNKITEYINKKN